MRKYIIFSVLIFLVAGCTPKLFRDLQMRPATSVKIHRGNLMPAFDRLETAKYYTAQIDFKENSMSGILALTKESEGQFRMVMMTTFGITLFDFSISRDSFIVNSCMEQMNKKVVLNILEKDFRSIFMLNVPEQFSARYYKNPQKPNWIGYGVNADDGECDYLIYPRETGFVRNIQNGGSIKRMNAVFDEQVVTIHHPKLKLKLVLTEMQQ